MTTFAQRLLYARTQRDLTQTQLAALCGLSQSTIANYESGARQQPRNLRALAQALKVNPLWLEQGRGAMQLNLTDVDKEYVVSWPFTGISVKELDQLTEQQRTIIENLVHSVMDAWRHQK